MHKFFKWVQFLFYHFPNFTFLHLLLVLVGSNADLLAHVLKHFKLVSFGLLHIVLNCGTLALSINYLGIAQVQILFPNHFKQWVLRFKLNLCVFIKVERVDSWLAVSARSELEESNRLACELSRHLTTCIDR